MVLADRGKHCALFRARSFVRGRITSRLVENLSYARIDYCLVFAAGSQ